jgi:hypothetical protein
MQPTQPRLDGNAAAGVLDSVFSQEMTLALTICDGCGAERQVGALAVYVHGMGFVIRCPDCDTVLIKVGTSPRHHWLDMRGLRCLRVDVGV